jgi:hypothetical protein
MTGAVQWRECAACNGSGEVIDPRDRSANWHEADGLKCGDCYGHGEWASCHRCGDPLDETNEGGLEGAEARCNQRGHCDQCQSADEREAEEAARIVALRSEIREDHVDAESCITCRDVVRGWALRTDAGCICAACADAIGRGAEALTDRAESKVRAILRGAREVA